MNDLISTHRTSRDGKTLGSSSFAEKEKLTHNTRHIQKELLPQQLGIIRRKHLDRRLAGIFDGGALPQERNVLVIVHLRDLVGVVGGGDGLGGGFEGQGFQR